MPFYKIHSLKDSNKLSFIIEWENEVALKQKLSGEGHIVLSVEKTEINPEKIFVFEWKKPDKTFIEWKIEAEDMFVAYDMLSKQYGYGISKLYPSTLDNIEEQQKVFQELLSTFEEKKILKPKTVTDTSSKTLIKYRSAGEKIKKLISEENTPLKDDILSEIKKLEHTSNTSTIKESLKNIIGKIQQHSNASIEKKLKPIAQDIGVFIAPSFLRKIGIKTRDFCTFITPIIHPQEILAVALPEKQKHTYEDIQNNSHIHILLQKKYQHMGIMNFSDEKSRQSYFYTVFRRNTWMFIFRKTLKATKHILFWSLIILALLCVVFSFSRQLEDMVVSSTFLIFFWFIALLSLVIPGDTV